MKEKMPIILVKGKKYFTLNPNINSHTNRYIAQGRTKDALDHVRLIQNTKPHAQIMMFGLVCINGLKMAPVYLQIRAQDGGQGVPGADPSASCVPLDPGQLLLHNECGPDAGQGPLSYPKRGPELVLGAPLFLAKKTFGLSAPRTSIPWTICKGKCQSDVQCQVVPQYQEPQGLHQQGLGPYIQG